MNAKTSWTAALGARIILLLGVAYVSLWWSYQQFYGVFGITPDDVGFTPAGTGLGDIIAAALRVGLWLSVALVVLGLLPVGVVAGVMYTAERKRVGQPDRENVIDDLSAARTWLKEKTVSSVSEAGGPPPSPSLRARIVVWAGALVALGILAGLVYLYGTVTGPVYTTVVVVLMVLIAVIWGNLSASSPVPAADPAKPAGFTFRWFQARQWWLLRAADVLLVAAVVGVLFVDLPDDARTVAKTLLSRADTAQECKVNGIGAPTGRFELDFLNVHALPATFAVKELPAGLPDKLPFRGIYLGTASGWLVVYQKSSRRIFRIPTSAGVSIWIDAGLAACHGAHGPNEQAS